MKRQKKRKGDGKDDEEDVSRYTTLRKNICLKIEEEALDRTVRRIRFGRGYGTVVRQTNWWWW